MGRGPGVRAVGGQAIQIDFRWKGQRCRERLRLAPTPRNLKFAAGLKARIEHEIATGNFDYGKHFPASAKLLQDRNVARGSSIHSGVLAYVSNLGDAIQPETAREYRHAAAQLAEALPGATFQSLTRSQVRQWVAGSLLSKKRLENILIPLRGALAQALEDGTIKENPLAGFRIRKVGQRKERIDPFTPAEVELLGRTVCGALWTAWAWTGARSGEIIGLRWGDLDSECRTLRVERAIRFGREKAPKTSAGRRVVRLLGPATEAFLSVRPVDVHDRRHEPIFRNPRTGGDWHEAKALAREFKRACKAAGVRYRYVYQLRHTFATWALSSGENPLWVARQMGHRDTGMVFRHYGKWMPDMDPTAGSRMVSKARRGQRAA